MPTSSTEDSGAGMGPVLRAQPQGCQATAPQAGIHIPKCLRASLATLLLRAQESAQNTVPTGTSLNELTLK